MEETTEDVVAEERRERETEAIKLHRQIIRILQSSKSDTMVQYTALALVQAVYIQQFADAALRAER
ncbi:MAG: hypothetical protein B7733_06240 [Myxococcales bacterium FL481]|nr:MAG: hypothetical protein B7733_06240 [Myxococcales bacterium FL481]